MGRRVVYDCGSDREARIEFSASLVPGKGDRKAMTPRDSLADRLAALLEQRYGARIAAVRTIADYGEAEGGVFRVDQKSGSSWVVRLSARGRPLDRVHGDAVVLAYASAHRVPAERLIRTSNGSGATDLNGQGVIVTGFIAGRRADRRRTTLRCLGEALGQLHALPPFPADDRWLGRDAGSLPAADLRLGRAHLERIAHRVPPERLTEYERLCESFAATDDCAALPTSLTHSDCHLDNAILTPEGQTILIDWVGSGQGPRIAALGVLLYSCAVRAPGDDATSPWATIWNEHGLPPNIPAPRHPVPHPIKIRSVVEAVVAGYCRHIRLTAAEQDHLPHAVRFRPLVIAAREFAASIDERRAPNPAGWWVRYAEADAVATHAQWAMERYR